MANPLLPPEERDLTPDQVEALGLKRVRFHRRSGPLCSIARHRYPDKGSFHPLPWAKKSKNLQYFGI